MTSMKWRVLAPAICMIFVLVSGSALADVFEQRTGNAVDLAPAAFEQTIIAQREIPIGTWVISAKVTVVNFGVPDNVRCMLVADDEIVDESAALIGGDGVLPAVTTLTNQRVLNPAAATTVQLVCYHEASVSGIFVDFGSSFIVAGHAAVDCTRPEDGTCLPGHEFTQVTELPEDAPFSEACVEKDECSAPSACIGPEFFESADRWHEPVNGEYLENPCPHSKPFKWYTTFSYCWCSAKSGR